MTGSGAFRRLLDMQGSHALALRAIRAAQDGIRFDPAVLVVRRN